MNNTLREKCLKYGVNLRIHSKCGKIRTRKTPYLDTLLAVVSFRTIQKKGFFSRT